MSEKSSSFDMRPVGAMICLACGIYLIAEAASYGGAWRWGAGFLCTAFGLIRGFYLLKNEHTDRG